MSSKKTEIYRTSSSEETKKLGFDLGQHFARRTAKEIRESGPIVLALQGDLGAGKTTFVQGFLKGLGSKKRVASPTFVLMRRHALPGARASKTARVGSTLLNAYHVDAYRLKKPEHLAALGFDGILNEPRNVLMIEWPEQAKNILPKNTMWLKFGHGKKENERTIKITR